jgi:hypothetical protein
MRIALLLIFILALACTQQLSPTLRVANPVILGPNEDSLIMINGELNS